MERNGHIALSASCWSNRDALLRFRSVPAGIRLAERDSRTPGSHQCALAVCVREASSETELWLQTNEWFQLRRM